MPRSTASMCRFRPNAIPTNAITAAATMTTPTASRETPPSASRIDEPATTRRDPTRSATDYSRPPFGLARVLPNVGPPETASPTSTAPTTIRRAPKGSVSRRISGGGRLTHC